MNPLERNVLLDLWFQRSSNSEDDRMKRAERMVRQAIKAHPALASVRYRVYPKGSYANQTNVRADSDVDIVVENQEACYYEYIPSSIQPSPDPHHNRYLGPWTPDAWRTEVTSALTSYFGSQGVDNSGNVAITVKEVPGSRPSADVVPAFDFIRYDSPDRSNAHEGSRVFSKGGTPINNFPTQQLTNGQQKDNKTRGRYKRYVRALKNAENALVREGKLAALPSYFIECLVWNVPNETLLQGNQYEGFETVLWYLYDRLDEKNFNAENWEEPNSLKWLFPRNSKWTPQQGQDLSVVTLAYLGYV